MILMMLLLNNSTANATTRVFLKYKPAGEINYTGRFENMEGGYLGIFKVNATTLLLSRNNGEVNCKYNAKYQSSLPGCIKILFASQKKYKLSYDFNIKNNGEIIDDQKNEIFIPFPFAVKFPRNQFVPPHKWVEKIFEKRGNKAIESEMYYTLKDITVNSIGIIQGVSSNQETVFVGRFDILNGYWINFEVIKYNSKKEIIQKFELHEVR